MKKILLFITLLTIVAFPQEHRFKGNVKVNRLEATAVDAQKITADSVFALHLVGVDTSYGGLDSIQVYNAIALKADKNSPTFTGTVTLPSTTSIGNVSSTELGYLDNVTGSIQTQINTKLNANAVRDSIDQYMTDSSATSNYTLAYIDKVVKNATISRYDISNPTLADTLMILWADDNLEIDSIKCYADDSTTIQIKMDNTNMLSSPYLIDDGVSSTITSISEGTLYADKKARLYFTALGNAVKKVHLKIYWRYL